MQERAERRQAEELRARSWWNRGELSEGLSDEQRQALDQQMAGLLEEEKQMAEAARAQQEAFQAALQQGDAEAVRRSLEEAAAAEAERSRATTRWRRGRTPRAAT